MKSIHVLLSALAALLLPVCSFAQDAPTFRSQSNLVLVPVHVRNHSKHVSGLAQDKFTILEDGKPQKIAAFEEVRTTTERLKRVPVGPQEFSNRVEGDPTTARFTIIAIDRINTTTMDMQRLRLGLLKFLGQAADSGEPIRLVAIEPSRLEMLCDFTTDPKVLAAAVNHTQTPAGKTADNSTYINEPQAEVDAGLQEQFAEGKISYDELLTGLAHLDSQKETEQSGLLFQQRSRRINSLEALQMLAQSLEGLPGRKSVVWASSGYPFGMGVREGRGGVNFDFTRFAEAGELDEYTIHLLNAANIALYPLDARGTVNTAWDVMDTSHKYSPSYAEKQSAALSNQDIITTFVHLAESTGGKPCYERADVSGCFKDALDDARDYYMIGFYVDPNTKPGWHKLQVKVSEDANVRSRTGFIFSKLDPKDLRANDMRLQLSSNLIDPGIPFVGSWNINDSKTGKQDIGFELKILPQAKLVSEQDPHLDVEITAVARARDGKVAGQFYQHVDRQLPVQALSVIANSGIDYKNSMALSSGDYLVRVVVRDNPTGRMGSTSTLVRIP